MNKYNVFIDGCLFILFFMSLLFFDYFFGNRTFIPLIVTVIIFVWIVTGLFVILGGKCKGRQEFG